MLHPDQIAIANEVFTPDAEAFARAAQVLEVYEATSEAGSAAAAEESPEVKYARARLRAASEQA